MMIRYLNFQIYLNALQRATVESISIYGKSADWIVVSGHGRHNLQLLDVPHLYTVVH